jgi:hypothetical protein
MAVQRKCLEFSGRKTLPSGMLSGGALKSIEYGALGVIYNKAARVSPALTLLCRLLWLSTGLRLGVSACQALIGPPQAVHQ